MLSARGGLAATFDLAALLVSMIAPVKKSVNHVRILPSMRITGKYVRNGNMFRRHVCSKFAFDMNIRGHHKRWLAPRTKIAGEYLYLITRYTGL